MRKPTIMLLLLLASTQARGGESDNLQVGAVGVTHDSLYQGVEREEQLFPMLLAEYGDFYFHGFQLGYSLLGGEGTSLAVHAEYGADGYDAKDSDALAGMRDRDHAVNGGLVLTHALPTGKLELKLLHDVSGTHHGYSATLQYEHRLRMSESGTTSAYLGVGYMDSEWADYYYGVRAAEARAGRPAYEQDAVAGAFIGVRNVTRLSERVTLMGGVGYRVLDDAITRSPIVDRRDALTAFVGIAYRLWP